MVNLRIWRLIELRNTEPEIDFGSRREKILSDHPEFKLKVSQIAKVFRFSSISRPFKEHDSLVINNSVLKIAACS